MNINQIEQIISKDKIFINEPMKKYTSFKIGGPAECLVKISKIKKTPAAINHICHILNSSYFAYIKHYKYIIL